MKRTAFLSILCALASVSVAEATELTSASFRLRGPTVAGGGAIGLESTAPGPTLRAHGVTIGPPSPLGVSVGAASGVRLQMGFWPTVGGGAAGEDSDGDGVVDALDNCVDEPNGPLLGSNDQLDVDADGFGNACDGDLNQDDFVGGPDFDGFLLCFNQATGAGAGPPTDPDCRESDMNGDAFVGGPDFDLFLRVFNGPPGPTGL